MMAQKSSAFSLVMFSIVLKQSFGLLGENFFWCPWNLDYKAVVYEFFQCAVDFGSGDIAVDA